MNTPLIANLIEQPDFKAQVKSQVPLGRIGEPRIFTASSLCYVPKPGPILPVRPFYRWRMVDLVSRQNRYCEAALDNEAMNAMEGRR